MLGDRLQGKVSCRLKRSNKDGSENDEEKRVVGIAKRGVEDKGVQWLRYRIGRLREVGRPNGQNSGGARARPRGWG